MVDAGARLRVVPGAGAPAAFPAPPGRVAVAVMDDTHTPDTYPRTVLWSRGEGCAQLAELLAAEAVYQIDGDPRRACVDHRADMVVMKRLGSFDLVPVAAPSGLDPGAVSTVVAAVGEGPHSELACLVAARIADALGVDAEAITAVRPGEPRATHRGLAERLGAAAGISGRVVEADSASGLIAHLDDGALLVLGAPGGSWINRQFIGPGARLMSQAPSGTVVVRDAPRRAFQTMTEPEALSVHMRAGDAVAVIGGRVMPVTDDGTLVGVVRAAAIADAEPGAVLADLMEDPPLIDVCEEIDGLASLAEFFEGDPLPLVDESGSLRGMLTMPTGGR